MVDDARLTRNERPCIYKYSCGYDFCLMEDCLDYIEKTKDNEYYGMEKIKGWFNTLANGMKNQ